jgi:hypothetical protein
MTKIDSFWENIIVKYIWIPFCSVFSILFIVWEDILISRRGDWRFDRPWIELNPTNKSFPFDFSPFRRPIARIPSFMVSVPQMEGLTSVPVMLCHLETRTRSADDYQKRSFWHFADSQLSGTLVWFLTYLDLSFRLFLMFSNYLDDVYSQDSFRFLLTPPLSL